MVQFALALPMAEGAIDSFLQEGEGCLNSHFGEMLLARFACYTIQRARTVLGERDVLSVGVDFAIAEEITLPDFAAVDLNLVCLFINLPSHVVSDEGRVVDKDGRTAIHFFLNKLGLRLKKLLSAYTFYLLLVEKLEPRFYYIFSVAIGSVLLGSSSLVFFSNKRVW